MDMREKLQAVRKTTGWTQDELAAQLGVAQSTVNRWTASVKPSQPKGPNWDAINRLYEKEVGTPDSLREFPLPESITMKFFSLPETKQSMIVGVLASIIDIAE